MTNASGGIKGASRFAAVIPTPSIHSPEIATHNLKNPRRIFTSASPSSRIRVLLEVGALQIKWSGQKFFTQGVSPPSWVSLRNMTKTIEQKMIQQPTMKLKN